MSIDINSAQRGNLPVWSAGTKAGKITLAAATETSIAAAIGFGYKAVTLIASNTATDVVIGASGVGADGFPIPHIPNSPNATHSQGFWLIVDPDVPSPVLYSTAGGDVFYVAWK